MHSDTKKLPTLGFVGTGTISTALVTAFCLRDVAHPYPIVVSPQYEEKAAMLKARFPERVSIADSLQEVADRSDWLFLAVLPQAGEEVCRSIRFRPEHKVVNLIMGKTFEQLRSWIGETELLTHIIPMTFIAEEKGPIVLCPQNAVVKELLSPISEVVEVPSRHLAAALQAITGFGASVLTLINNLVVWGKEQGLEERVAIDYVSQFFAALANQARVCDGEDLHVLAEEATPGGLNSMAREFIASKGGFDLWLEILNPMMDRAHANKD